MATSNETPELRLVITSPLLCARTDYCLGDGGPSTMESNASLEDGYAHLAMELDQRWRCLYDGDERIERAEEWPQKSDAVVHAGLLLGFLEIAFESYRCRRGKETKYGH